MNKYTSRVEKGIEFLNEEVPDWHKAIELESLDLLDCEVCILGQLFKNYYDALECLFPDDDYEAMPQELGFTADLHGDFELLTETWKLALDKS